MARIHLTDVAVRALKPTEAYVTYWDTMPGFGIRVGKKSKTWTVMRGRSRERVTIGRYPEMSLSDARTEAKRLLSTAPEPKQSTMRFDEARTIFLEENYKASKSRAKYHVTHLLKNHFKAFEHKQLVEITDVDIRRSLDKMSHTPSAQLHAYRAIKCFLRWCTRPPRRYVRHSPMEGYVPPGKDRKGTRTLSDDELKAVWEACGEGSRSIFRLLILWGTRNTETTLLKRNWIVGNILTIPGESTKNGRDHGIPILPLAKAVLDARPEAGPHYFQGRYSNEASLTAGALNRMKREIQEETGTKDWQIRDIRRTFRSNMARLKVSRDVCEVLINHAPPILDEIYDRYDRVEEKREALERYESFIVNLLAQTDTASEPK